MTLKICAKLPTANSGRHAAKLAVTSGFGDCTILFLDLSFGVSFDHKINLWRKK